MQGKKDPANIRVRKRCQHANHLQHILRLAEEERLHDNAVGSEQFLSATPSSSQPLPPPPRCLYLLLVPPDNGEPTIRLPAATVTEPGALVANEVCLYNLRLSIVAIRSMQDNAQITANFLK